jgi:hypothetical protein
MLTIADEFGSSAVGQKIDTLARELFVSDPEVSRDRAKYGIFDRMPPELQEWWKERAIRTFDPQS